MTALLEWCSTKRQREIISALIECEGSPSKASQLLYERGNGTDATNISRALKHVKIKAAKAGYSPENGMDQVAPAPYNVKGTSTLYKLDEDTGEKRQVMQWVKTDLAKDDAYNSMLEAWNAFAEGIDRAEPLPEPAQCEDDLLCDYTIGDAHIGLYAWAAEAGDDWDLAKGVDILRKGINRLVDSAPAAGTAFILDVGDFMHSDNQSNETSHSKNKLDVDGRWAKVTESALSCICDMIDMALQKHKQVIYRSVIGNHNEHAAVMMNIAVKFRYHNEPRLTVLDSPAMHNYYQFGVNLLADTHGHTTKADKLPLLMATDVPMMWATTTNRVWRTGHVHHESVKEYSGATVVTYRTLTPKDSWHAGQGYRSNREIQMTVYHKTTGRVGAHYVNPSMLGY